MSRQRRIRDDTGASVYYDTDTLQSVDISGAGVFNTVKNVATKVASKLTGKAAKRMATKAAEKLLEKGAEKVGEKTGQLIGEKIYDRFTTTTTSQPTNENKGYEIIKELQSLKKPNQSKKSISQQFDELLKL